MIYSISRHRLNQTLIELAARLPRVTVHFEHRFETADFDAEVAFIRDIRHDRLLSVPMQPLLATDGAGSAMRRRMSTLHIDPCAGNRSRAWVQGIDHTRGSAASHRMAADALHIWPRGNYMLIALPNEDGSFTATLFLAKKGELSFASLTDSAAVDSFSRPIFPTRAS